MPCGCSGLDDPLDVMLTPGTPTMLAVGLAWGVLWLSVPRAQGRWASWCPGPVVPTHKWVHMGSAAWEARGLVTVWPRLTCRGPLSCEAGAGAGTSLGG